MNPNDVFATASRLQDAGTAYALVTVLRAEAPTSARPGDKAVVTAAGDIQGWIGGGCAQPAVVKTVRQALTDGKARLIRIAPSNDGERELGDVLEFGMACHSGGTLELFVDPVLPQPQLVILGASPVGVALAQLAPRLGFAVSVAAAGAQVEAYPEVQRVLATDDAERLAAQLPTGAYVVVATQGRRDVQALRAALALGARQVSFIASARKAAVLKESLLAAGADAAALEAIVAPAGYPIAASTPEEIALSVLAALIAHRRGATEAAAPIAAPMPAGDVGAKAISRPRDATPASNIGGDAACCSTAAAAPQASAVAAPERGAVEAGSCCSSTSATVPAAVVTATEPIAPPKKSGGSCCGG